MDTLYRRLAIKRKRQRMFFEQINNHATGGVRFNLAGRERFGVVADNDLQEVKNSFN